MLFEVLFEIVPSVVVVDDVETDVCVLFVGIEVCGCVELILAIALSISSTTVSSPWLVIYILFLTAIAIWLYTWDSM